MEKKVTNCGECPFFCKGLHKGIGWCNHPQSKLEYSSRFLPKAIIHKSCPEGGEFLITTKKYKTMNNIKLIPFDLEKALNGHPWGTRDGRRGKKIFDTERVARHDARLYALFENEEGVFSHLSGSYFGYRESNNDLFLYSEQKTGWVVVCVSEGDIYSSSFTSAEEEDKNEYEGACKEQGRHIATFEVNY